MTFLKLQNTRPALLPQMLASAHSLLLTFIMIVIFYNLEDINCEDEVLKVKKLKKKMKKERQSCSGDQREQI